jgi:hypothetical protein
VTKHKPGDRVVVCSFIACGRCWYCEQKLYSLYDNGNPNPAITEALWGYSPGGCFGYSHALGGFAGSHADYIRVPYADQGAFRIPDEVDDMTALFASDAAATGWTAADQIGVQPGTWSRYGARAPSARWRRGPRCSRARSGSWSSTGCPSGLHVAVLTQVKRSPLGWAGCAGLPCGGADPGGRAVSGPAGEPPDGGPGQSGPVCPRPAVGDCPAASSLSLASKAWTAAGRLAWSCS